MLSVFTDVLVLVGAKPILLGASYRFDIGTYVDGPQPRPTDILEILSE